MSVIITKRNMPNRCEECEFRYIGRCIVGSEKHTSYEEQYSDCPLKSVEGLIAKVLSEVDGGTDDKYIRYIDVCERIEKSIKEYCEVSE